MQRQPRRGDGYAVMGACAVALVWLIVISSTTAVDDVGDMKIDITVKHVAAPLDPVPPKSRADSADAHLNETASSGGSSGAGSPVERLAAAERRAAACEAENRRLKAQLHHGGDAGGGSDVSGGDDAPVPTPAPPVLKKHATPRPHATPKPTLAPATPAVTSGESGDDHHVQHAQAAHGPPMPVVVFTYNRPDTLKTSLEMLDRVMPEQGFHLYVSQDGHDTAAVGQVVERFIQEHPRRKVIHFIHKRDDSGATIDEKEKGWQPYYAIAHHYKFAIDRIFASKEYKYERIIILEDDLAVADDFFSLMKATAPLFDKDATLYCVSGFNDNGKPAHVADPRQLYRSDFFPGLGWMTSRAVWEELSAIWPKGFWDDWMRQPDKRKARVCIRPEVPRSKALCNDEGVSQGQFCAEHLQAMQLARDAVDWSSVNVNAYVKAPYDAWLAQTLSRATFVDTPYMVETLPSDREAKLRYSNNDELAVLEGQLDLMTDFKDGVPRTAYKGVITTRFKGHRVHLVSTHPLYEYE